MTFYIHNWAELLAAVTATYCLLRKKTFLNRFFTGFLWLTFFVELLGKYFSSKHIANGWLYNLFNPIEIVFYTFLLYRYTAVGWVKKTMKAGTVLYLLFAAFNLLFIEGLYTYNHFSAIAGSLVILVWCGLFFQQYINGDLVEYQPAYKSIFPIIIGLTLFYLGSYVFFSSYGYLTKDKLNIPLAIKMNTLINRNLNGFMYFLFAYGLIVDNYSVKEFKRKQAG